VKHKPYLHLTGYEIDRYVETWRCENCDAEFSLGVRLFEKMDCPNTGAPDWEALDRAAHEAGLKRVMERMRKRQAGPQGEKGPA